MTQDLDDALRAVLDPVPARFAVQPGLRSAAVLAPLFDAGGIVQLLFTQRTADLPHHAGQISFPGGVAHGDESPLACALREAREEIGLDPRAVQALGALPPRHSGAGFLVHTIVARVDAGLVLTPDPREVEALVAFPLHELRDPLRWLERVPEILPQRPPSPHFERDGRVLWGLTARLVRELCERLG